MQSKSQNKGISIIGVMLVTLLGIIVAFNNLDRADEILRVLKISVNLSLVFIAGVIYLFHKKKGKWKRANENFNFNICTFVLVTILAIFFNAIA
ncbi:hypothetical protein A7L81_19540 [Acinetobacter baumannii]|nr:hypothetical protein A7L34_12510 [Acinetobacter baumannii]OIE93351.1 hypothetical protein A7L81_19540 [Acinetobacter baumannii]OIF15462.1 hypothetical protein A7L98_09375 [Acinetobacter baumannii]